MWSDDPERAAAKGMIVEEVERLRWRLWNGKARDAKVSIDQPAEEVSGGGSWDKDYIGLGCASGMHDIAQVWGSLPAQLARMA